ncbi:MAG: proline dehydrogenase family protein [bacterium]|nr:proline dehydrogenase family protein [bacterium]
MISFDNTENAFKGKTNAELRRSYWLFKLIGSPFLVKIGAELGPVALNLGLKGILKSTIFKQFVGGETIHDCSAAIKLLADHKVGTILDYSVEGKESETDFDTCRDETIATIHKAKTDKNIPFCVFKVTGLAHLQLLQKVSSNEVLAPAEKEQWDRVKNRVSKICQTAYENDQPIFIDAEESWIQPAIDELANTNMALCNKTKVIVYNTFQLYRTDRLEYLRSSFQNAISQSYYLGAKLVRGAYMEKERERADELNYPSPIHTNKEGTDRDYDLALKFCVENINNMALCAGSHNESSSLHLLELMKQHNLSASDPRIYFSQLLGMSDHISFNLSTNGYCVAKYVPYGPIHEVLPYLIRRAQENTSVEGQTGRELNLIMKEKQRRRALK